MEFRKSVAVAPPLIQVGKSVAVVVVDIEETKLSILDVYSLMEPSLNATV